MTTPSLSIAIFPLLVSSSSSNFAFGGVQGGRKKEDEDEKEAIKKEEDEEESTRPEDDWKPGNWCWLIDVPTSSITVGVASHRFTKDEAVDDDDDDGKIKTEEVMDNKEDEEDETRTIDNMQEHGKLRGMEQQENDEETRKKEDKEDEKRKEEKRNAVVFRTIHNTSTNRNTNSNQKAEEEEGNHKDAVYNNRNDGWTTGNWSWLPATRSHPANGVAIEPTRTRRNRTADRFRPKQGNIDDSGGGKMKSEAVLSEEDDDHDNDNGSFPPLSSSVSGIPRRTNGKKNCNRTHNDDRNDVWATGNWSWLPVPQAHPIASVARRTVAVETITRTRKKRTAGRIGRPTPPKKRMRRGIRKTNEDLDYHSDTDTDTNTVSNDVHDSNIDEDQDSEDEGVSKWNDGSDKDKARWKEMYERLIKYKEQYKSTCVPYRYNDDRRLGRWVEYQRTRHTNKQLSLYRINRLESIGFVWSVSYDARWTEMFERLVAYKKIHNSTCVPRPCTSDPSLGEWVRHQRDNYNSKNPLLTKDRIRRLNSIQFEWNPPTTHHRTPWPEMYKRLVAYKKKYNSTCVPPQHKDDPPLGNWVHKQRTNFKIKHPRLTADRIRQLVLIGFDWNPNDTQWMEMYKRLVEYKKKYKTTCVPLLYREDSQLGKWVSHQRTVFKKKRITAERMDRLESLGFVGKFADDMSA